MNPAVTIDLTRGTRQLFHAARPGAAAAARTEHRRWRGMRRGHGWTLALSASLLAAASSTAPVGASAASPAAVARTPLRVLVLGDSYSAGNGAGAQYGPAACWRSRRSYAELYAAALRAAPHRQPATVTNAACSGAVVQSYVTARSASLPAQRAAVSPAYDEVFLTLGGNDASFGDIVRNCLFTGTSEAAACDATLTKTEQLLAGGASSALGKRLQLVLSDVRARTKPRASIVLLGYPFLEGDRSLTLASDTAGEPPVAVGRRLYALGVSADQVQAVSVAAVNRLKQNAGRRPILFESVHQLFGVPGTSGYHGLYANRVNPQRWMVQPGVDGSAELAATFYHPNPIGWAKEAALLIADQRIPHTLPLR